MANPISAFMNDDEGKRLGGELREKLEMQKAAGDSLKTPTSAPVKPMPVKTMPMDKTNSQGPYGTGAGEKRIDTSYPGNPMPKSLMPKMHDGGTVMHSGPHNLQKGEKVLTQEQHGKLRAAMGLAHDALSHETEKEKEPEMPKHLKEIHIKELHTGGFHVTKHSGRPGDEPTVHGAANTDALHEHIEDHMGSPNDGEEASENEMDESPGVVAIQKEVGFKK